MVQESDLQTTTKRLEEELSKVAERDEELKTLRSCLLQVTEQVSSKEEAEENEEAEVNEEEEDIQKKREEQLKKIQAMLDTTKVFYYKWLEF